MEHTNTKSRRRIRINPEKLGVNGRHRILANPEKWGVNENTYEIAPKCYYDVPYTCLDCKKKMIWSAEKQKYWYEALGKNKNSRAIRCQICRCHIQAIKEQQKRHMANLAKDEK